jgi:PhnB protein
MIEKKNTENSQDQVRALLESWAAAIRAKDVSAVVSLYAPEIVSFDLAPPLVFAGLDSLRTSLEAWFPTFRGPVGYEILGLTITSGEDVAFARSLNRISGERTNGETVDVWVRATFGCRRIGGKWLIAHEHVSVPFYMDGSDKAALDLTP